MRVVASLAMAASLALSSASGARQVATAAAPFPGDIGRPFDGLPLPENPAERRFPWPSMPPAARGPSVAVAVQMARQAVAACKGQHIGVSVIDASGLPKLYYVADGAAGYHAYTAFRKAYTALTFKMATSAVGDLSKTNASVAARITADTNLLAFPGGVPIMVGGKIIGAIAVSGVIPRPGDEKTNPGLADERCAKAGLDRYKSLLN